MNVQQAYDSLDPQSWVGTSVVDRLGLIEEIQHNLKSHARELGEIDTRMKNELIGADGVHWTEGMGTTVNPMGNTLMGCQHLYESLAHGEMPAAVGSHALLLDDDTYEVQVFPIHKKDKIVAGKRKANTPQVTLC